MNVANILIKPLISEKSQKDSENGKYVFLVLDSANKAEIKEAVKEVFDVTPVDIKVMAYMRKKKRNLKGKERFKYPTRGKKAIIKLQKGDVINIFDQGEK